MKNLKISLAAILALSISFTTFTSCEEAVDGEDGINGVDGTNGLDGTDGQDGSDGKDYDYIDLSNPLTASTTPNFLKLTSAFSSATVTPILSSEDVIPGAPDFVYGSMADGAGLLAEDDGTFTLINNIEADYSIARITLNSDLQPAYGEYILNASATGYTAQCSGSLVTPEEHGFGPLYLSGGEWGGASKGVFATNPYKSAQGADNGTLLPALGQWSTENAVALNKEAFPGYTVILIGDDHSDNSEPSGQLGMYVSSTGNLTGGSLLGLKVDTAGIEYEMDMEEGVSYEASFYPLEEREINALDAECKVNGVMGFSRLEDIDWRRGSAANNREIYFAVTGRDKDALKDKGTISGRIYKVVLEETMFQSSVNGQANPNYLKATITCVLDGDNVSGEAAEFLSPDNILVTENYAYIQEDPAITGTGVKDHYARLYQYDLANGTLNVVAECDQVAAAAAGYGSESSKWEITGMIDVTETVNNGENTFLVITQNHGWEPADGSSFTDPTATFTTGSRAEGSVLHVITGLER